MRPAILGLLLALGAQLLSAQTNIYNFEVDNQPWEPLQNSVNLLPGEVWDDPELAIPIGFPFSYFGKTQDSLFQIDLGAGFVFEQSHIEGPEGVPIPLIFPYISDIIDRGDITGVSQSPISYLVDGAPGERIFKLEYLNAGFFEDFTGDDFVNFQLWLHEATGIIEVRFGPRQITNFEEVHFDWGGPSVFLIDGYELFPGGTTGNISYWASVTGSTTDPILDVQTDLDPAVLDMNMIPVMSGDPVDGAVYRFLPSMTVGVSQPEKPQILNLYPTLAATKITVDCPSAGIVRVVSLHGTVVHTAKTGPGLQTINVSDMLPGMYFVHFSTGAQRFIARFSKH